MIVTIFWIFKANPGIIQKAWKMCVAKDINLGADLLQDQSITSSQLMEYFDTHLEFREEITTAINSDPLQDFGVEPERDDEVGVSDDSEVPLAVVIEKSLGLDVALETDNHFGIAHGTAITLQDGRLTAGENLSENIPHGKSSDELDLTESDSDSDSAEETDEELNKETSEEIN